MVFDSIRQQHHVVGTNNHDALVVVGLLMMQKQLKAATIGMKMANYPLMAHRLNMHCRRYHLLEIGKDKK